MDRRSFFSRLIGGAAAAVAAPHVNTPPTLNGLKFSSQPRWNIIARTAGKRLYYGTQSVGGLTTFPNTNIPLPAIEFDPGQLHIYENIEQIPDCEINFAALENNRVSIERYLTQDGLGVSSESWFGETIPGCPTGYY